jgi:hypothetical protein
MTNKFLIISLISLSILNINKTFSQNKDFAIKIIKELTSPYYYGRAYQKNGINKTAKYIVKTLKNCKIQCVYKQKISFPVSYIKKINYLFFDTISPALGNEYIVYPNSCSIKGKYKLYKVNNTNFKDIFKVDLADKFVAFDTSLTENPAYSKEISSFVELNPVNAKGFIIYKTKKLMQKQSIKTFPWVTIEADYKFYNSNYISLHLKSTHKNKYKSYNIIAIIPGNSDTIVAYSAHYDHLGGINNIYFPGANDNASGVAMTIDIACELAKENNKYTLAFLFFTGEECGLIGSSFFADNPIFDLNKVKYLFNLDVIGSGENGLGIVNGTLFKDIVEQMKKIVEENNLGLEFKLRGNSHNSDHAPFYEKGVKALFIYSMGKAGAYHNSEDVIENLSLAKYNEITKLLINLSKY